MLATEAQTLDEKIVTLLAARPGRTAQDLLEHCSTRRRKYTIQAIYKELRKLEALGAVHRLKKRYNLRVAWSQDLLKLAERACESSLDISSLLQDLPRSGKKKTWTFTNLRRLDSFWTELIIALSSKAPAQPCYQWIPYPWFHLINPDEEDRFIRSAKSSKTKYHIIVGGTTTLFKSYEALLPRSNFSVTYKTTGFESQKSEYLNVLGNYILRISFGKKRTAALQEIFSEQKRKAEDQAGNFEVFYLQDPMKVEFLHSPALAESLQRKFKKALKNKS